MIHRARRPRPNDRRAGRTSVLFVLTLASVTTAALLMVDARARTTSAGYRLEELAAETRVMEERSIRARTALAERSTPARLLALQEELRLDLRPTVLPERAELALRAAAPALPALAGAGAPQPAPITAVVPLGFTGPGAARTTDEGGAR